MEDGSHGNGRLRRPRLERTAPDRSLGSVFGTPPLTDGWGFSDVARASIETAYRVVDAQLEYGRQMAQQLGVEAPFKPANGASAGDGGAASLEPLFTAYAAGLAEVTSVWLRVMQDMLAPDGRARSASTEQPAETATPPTDAGPALEPRRLLIPLSLRSGETGSVEIPALNGVDAAALRVSALKCRDDDAAFLLVQVTVSADGDTARLSVRAPRGQRPGVYDAVISEPSGRLIGALCVTVEAG